MSAPYRVLLTGELLAHICDYNGVQDTMPPGNLDIQGILCCVKHSRNTPVLANLHLLKNPVARDQVLQCAVVNNNLPVIQMTDKQYKQYVFTEWQSLFASAIENCRPHVADWLYANKRSLIGDKPVDIRPALKKGCIATLNWVYDNVGPQRIDRIRWCNILNHMSAAARENRIISMEWLFQKKLYDPKTCPDEAMIAAVAHGHLEAVKWLCEKFEITNIHGIVELASEFGRMAIIKWLYSCEKVRRLNPIFASPFAIVVAAKVGHKKLVEWFYKNRGQDIGVCLTCAASIARLRGHFAIAKWLDRKDTERFCKMHFSVAVSSLSPESMIPFGTM